MDARQFVEAFPHLNEGRSSEDSPRFWMGHFNALLSDRLLNGKTSSRIETRFLLSQYEEWTRDRLPSLSELTTTAHLPKADRFSMGELLFHQLNKDTIELWESFLLQKELTSEQLRDMQLRIAEHALPTIQELWQVLDTGVFEPLILEDIETDAATQDQQGMLHDLFSRANEADTLITLIGWKIENPHLEIVPTPTQYEANPNIAQRQTGRKNGDFTVIDANIEQVRNIQAKTNLSKHSKFTEYNPDFVTIIDGVADLGGTLARRRGVVTTQPGLLALEVINDMDTADPAAKEIANNLAGNIRPYLAQAIQNISGRLLRDLMKQPVPETNDAKWTSESKNFPK